jgi:hypothetical protein
MQSNTGFNGLTMPVFAAFGWAGEEAAINFALDQLEHFINDVYAVLSRDARTLFPFHGVDRQAQIAFLGSEEEPESKLFISIAARPASLETNLAVRNKEVLTKALRAMVTKSETFFDLITELGSEWFMHLQQMEYDPDAGTTTHYQDLFKDKISTLDVETASEKVARAQYLNSEDKWIVPVSIYRRSNSEKIASMGYNSVSVLAEQINSLMPLALLLSGKTRKRKSTPKTRKAIAVEVEETAIRQPADSAELGTFTYVSHLQPLHIRRGFINLTPKHWPFFSINARTVTRPVMLKYGESKDKDCAVWRLSPNNLARLVLSSPVQDWVEENFDDHDSIQVVASKSSDKLIDIELLPVQ